MKESIKKRFYLPFRTEFALKRLVSALEHDGYPDANISIVNYGYGRISLFDKDHNQRYITPIKDGWIEHITIDEFGGSSDD